MKAIIQVKDEVYSFEIDSFNKEADCEEYVSNTNHPLRQWREKYNLSIDALAKETGLSERTLLRAEQGSSLYPSTRRLVVEYFTKLVGRSVSSYELGLLVENEKIPHRALEITTMDTFRRSLLIQTLHAAGAFLALQTPIDVHRLVSVFTKPESLDSAALLQLESILEHLWHMSQTRETTKVEHVLPLFLPHIVTLAHQATRYQRRAAHLAAQAYILSAEVDHGNVKAMNAFCQQAIVYSEIAENNDIQVASIKQQATIFLVGKQSQKAYETYQKALPMINEVTPLLQSRIYLGLASASARCRQKEDTLTYLKLAQDIFPLYPENDPNYLYTICSTPVLRLYEALTYIDMQEPRLACESLEAIDGIYPKISIAESTRIEILNVQAKTAALLGEMEMSAAYLCESVAAASRFGYGVWLEEANDVYHAICNQWPNEHMVKELAALF